MRLLLASIIFGFGVAATAEVLRMTAPDVEAPRLSDRAVGDSAPQQRPTPIPDAAKILRQDEQPDRTPPVSRLETFNRLKQRLEERSRQEIRLLEQGNKALLAGLGIAMTTAGPGVDTPAAGGPAATSPGTLGRPVDNRFAGAPPVKTADAANPALKDWSRTKKLADSLDQGCDGTDCLKLEGLFTIKSVEGKVQPGAVIVLHGKFGEVAGQVILLYKNWKKEPKWEALANQSWSNETVAVWLPHWMEGFEDQLAQLRVRRFELNGPDFPVSLKATVEHRILGYPDPANKLVSCGSDANINCCNGKKDSNDPLYTAGAGYGVCPVQASVTVSGAHRNAWGAVGNDEGSDRYSIKLENGWKLMDVEIDANPPCCKTVSSAAGYTCWNEDCVDQPTPEFSQGATHWTPQIHWIVSPADTVSYDASVAIAGPKGVPHY